MRDPLPRSVEDFLGGPLKALLHDFLAEQNVTVALQGKADALNGARRRLDVMAEICRQLRPLMRQAMAGSQEAHDEALALLDRLSGLAQTKSDELWEKLR